MHSSGSCTTQVSERLRRSLSSAASHGFTSGRWNERDRGPTSSLDHRRYLRQQWLSLCGSTSGNSPEILPSGQCGDVECIPAGAGAGDGGGCSEGGCLESSGCC